LLQAGEEVVLVEELQFLVELLLDFLLFGEGLSLLHYNLN
jgi:hypothetical protein